MTVSITGNHVDSTVTTLREHKSEIGEAFTMLTTDPGPDVAPYHNRQVAVIDRADWGHWLNPAVPARDILKPLPQGTLQVTQVR